VTIHSSCIFCFQALGYKGFVPVGGKSAKGAAFLKKAKSFYKK
jgi:hypothetical protein